MVGGTLCWDDKVHTVLGISSKCDQANKWLQDRVRWSSIGIFKDNTNRHIEDIPSLSRAPGTNINSTNIKVEKRRTSMRKWQPRWESSLNERWKFRLVPDVTRWMKNEHCELNYYVTQFLTGHGCFKKYLHRFGHDTSPLCSNCVDEEEDAEHILTCCLRFRWPGETSLGPNRLMEELLNCRVLWSQSENGWSCARTTNTGGMEAKFELIW